MIASALPSDSLADIAIYQRDAELSLRLYFSRDNPNYVATFAPYRPSEVAEMLVSILRETDMRSCLVVMARLEAAFRVDYVRRCEKKKADTVSVKFRRLWKQKGPNVRLEEEIFGVWREINPETKQVIGQLRSVFKFRHWLAHGRYWNVGNKYDFQTLYILAEGVLSSFPFQV